MFVSEVGDQVVALHKQGLKSLEIAYRLNVAQSTVHYHLRKSRSGAASPRSSRTRGRPAGSALKTRDAVASLLARGLSRAEVARRLGLSKLTITYHARRLGESIDDRFARRFDWPVIQAYYDEGHSLRECMRTFGFGNWSWQQAVARGQIVPRPRFQPLSEVFAVNTNRNRGQLKARLLKQGLKEDRCQQCGIFEWCGAPLSLALHHINGDRMDNRIENLELLCPNCHSQTETFSGRNGHGRALRAVPNPPA